MPLVSICMPCFNAAPYLKAAVESVIAQSWPEWELIIVNDGSSDDSEAVLSQIHDPRIRVVHETCGSAARSRNRAYSEATGDYIKFFDADDLLSPNMLSTQLARIKNCPDAVASSAWGRFYSHDLTDFRPAPQSVWRDMEASDWLVEAWADARPMMQVGMFLLPQQLLQRCGGWDETAKMRFAPNDDFEFFARILSHAREVRFVAEATLYYRSGIRNSLSQQKERKAIESAFHAILKGTSHLLAIRGDAAARRSCANVLQDFIYTHYPFHSDLRTRMKSRIRELGGSDLRPSGPPRFEALRRVIGWKLARRVQRLAGR